jgi:hypothetical protein
MQEIKNGMRYAKEDKNKRPPRVRVASFCLRPSRLCERAPPTGRAKQRPPLPTPQSAGKQNSQNKNSGYAKNQNVSFILGD